MNYIQYATRTRIPAETRFLKKISEGAPEECWEWQGFRVRQGYGTFFDGTYILTKKGRRHGRYVRTHRWAYEHFIGPIPEGIDVLHRCDNPPCCNPAHLFLGTQADNSADMVAKGRSASGPRHPRAKLTLAQVNEIRGTYTGRRGEQAALARRFGVSRQAVYAVIYRKVWG